MPTLDEVFELAPKGEFLFNIETKIFADHPELTPSPEEFVRLVLDGGPQAPSGIPRDFTVFRFPDAARDEADAPGIALSALYSGDPKDFTAIAKEAGAGIVSPEFHLVTPQQVRAAHAAGLQVVPWTPDTPEDWDRLIAAGVDAIITDDPAALLGHTRAATIPPETATFLRYNLLVEDNEQRRLH